MLRRLFKKTITEDVVVIDSRFPRPLPFGFRVTEINTLFKLLPDFKSYTMYPIKPSKGAWFDHGYGIERVEFDENKSGYLEYFPENKGRVKYLDPNNKYKIKLAYSYFLAETYTLLPFYEKNKIHFIFVLYPGGAFGLNNDGSDRMLKEIFSSKYFEKVIVTKDITHKYLQKKNLCPDEKIIDMLGFVQYTKDQILPKKFYKKDKKTFDICFVAAKYSEKGVDKGYDLFIETAKILVKKYPDIRFHVIGGFDENEIDISDIKKNIKFYGFKRPDFLRKFYTKMDIFLSPNREGKLYPGNFDGLMGADAGYMGVALFITDELNQHTYFKDRHDCVFINHEAEDISKAVEYYYKHPERLYAISKNGQEVLVARLDVDEQCEKRVELFKDTLKEIYG